MFRTAEVGNAISKSDFNKQVPALRIRMLAAQQKLRRADFPVILVFAGVDGAGKSECANLLNEWMDPRWIVTRAFGEPSDEEAERPEFWRYWRDLPPKGRIGCFLSSWYSKPVLDHVHGRASDVELDDALDRIINFERALANDGALILKFWMHLGRKAQKERFQALEKDPLTSWRVTPTDWEHWKIYDRFIAAAERTIMRTSKGRAPWQIVEGADPYYRGLTVATAITEAIEKHLAEHEAARRLAESLQSPMETTDEQKKKKRNGKNGKGGNGKTAEPEDWQVTSMSVAPGRTVLDNLDMAQSVEREVFDKELEALQGRLNRLSRDARDAGLSSILVFEGWDAAGKGGSIRRITAALDSRSYQVIPVAAPTDEEKAHHHLWRFWRHLSRAGRTSIFDRSWYGRVLVERVEGFASEAEWMRSYAEINDFEEQLVDHGIVLIKYWMHITKDEQLKRFKRRERIAYKRWKLTDEDWRNREKWEQYEISVNDMIARTSTSIAPWTLVEGNNKRFARLKSISTFCDKLEDALGRRTPGRHGQKSRRNPREERHDTAAGDINRGTQRAAVNRRRHHRIGKAGQTGKA